MNQNEAVFRDAPVRTAVVRMAVPTVISSLVLVIYNMADTFFVGQTHDAMQVAAVSLTNPVFVMFMAIATVLGNVCGCIYYVWYFMRRSSMLSIHPRHLRGDKHQMVQVVTINRQIVALFIDDASVIAYGGPMLFATSIAGPILGLLFLSINSMRALSRPLPAAMLSVCRQGLIFIPLLYLLNAGFDLDGINFTQAVADYISIVLGIILLV